MKDNGCHSELYHKIALILVRNVGISETNPEICLQISINNPDIRSMVSCPFSQQSSPAKYATAVRVISTSFK